MYSDPDSVTLSLTYHWMVYVTKRRLNFQDVLQSQIRHQDEGEAGQTTASFLKTGFPKELLVYTVNTIGASGNGNTTGLLFYKPWCLPCLSHKNGILTNDIANMTNVQGLSYSRKKTRYSLPTQIIFYFRLVTGLSRLLRRLVTPAGGITYVSLGIEKV
jgi:hypothetical protein